MLTLVTIAFESQNTRPDEIPIGGAGRLIGQGKLATMRTVELVFVTFKHCMRYTHDLTPQRLNGGNEMNVYILAYNRTWVLRIKGVSRTMKAMQPVGHGQPLEPEAEPIQLQHRPSTCFSFSSSSNWPQDHQSNPRFSWALFGRGCCCSVAVQVKLRDHKMCDSHIRKPVAI